MRALVLTGLVMAVIFGSGDAAAQSNTFEAIVRQCIADIQAGKKYGAEGDNPTQACIVEKKIRETRASANTESVKLSPDPVKPEVVQMGTARVGLEKPPLLNMQPQIQQPQPAAAPAAEDSFAGGVAVPAKDDVKTAVKPAPVKNTPSASQRYYLQSGKSGDGAKPVFLNR